MHGSLHDISHDHEADALPQAGSFYRPAMGKVLVHAERRGPAFDAAFAVRRLLGAIDRHVFLDVLQPWTDLLAALNLTPSPLSIESTDWTPMVTAIDKALLGSTGPDAEVAWAKADEHVRAYAMRAASDWDRQAQQTLAGDHWQDMDTTQQGEIVHAFEQSARLRAFAKAAA